MKKNADLRLISASGRATRELAARLARQLKPGTVLALTGELGAGKTTFVKGLARGLGIKAPVTSPSFLIVKEYHQGRLPLFHFDLYRLKKAAELGRESFLEYLDRAGVVVLEWADRLPELLPAGCLKLTFKWLGPNRRALTLAGPGGRNKNILLALKRSLSRPKGKK